MCELLKVLTIILLSLNLSKQMSSNLVIRGRPPINIINKPKGGDGGENGIRVISKDECRSTVKKWFSKLGVASGPSNFEKLEMLMYLDRFSQEIPGPKPLRNEYLALGQFENSQIECIAAILWEKRTFPAEMNVAMIFQSQSSLDNKIYDMITFIRELCIDNAILANFSHLQNYENFQNEKYSAIHDRSIGASDELKYMSSSADKSIHILSQMYADLNKSPSVCLDLSSNTISQLEPYWYMTFIPYSDAAAPSNNAVSESPNSPHRSATMIPLYFRQKSRELEYEICFQRPETGTKFGSGTVGGPLIVPIEKTTANIGKIINKVDVERVAEAIKKKIIHPPSNLV